MSENKWLQTEVKEIIVYIFIGVFMLGILPFIGGFILKGFEGSILSLNPQSGEFNASAYLVGYLSQFLLYLFLIPVAISLVIYPIGRLVAIKRSEHPADQSKPSRFTPFTVSLIHSPEENGLLYRLFHYFEFTKNPMNFSFSMFRMLMLSIIFFGTFGLIQQVYPQLSVSDVPQTAQQFSTASDVIFGSAVPAFAENGVLLFIFFFLLGLDAYICSRFKWGLIGFFTFGILICALMGVVWVLFHAIVYGNNDVARFATFIFGFMGTLLTLLFASIIPFLVWHFMNNFSIKIGQVATVNEDVIFIWIVVLVVFTLVYIMGEVLLRRFRKKREYIPLVPQ